VTFVVVVVAMSGFGFLGFQSHRQKNGSVSRN